MDELTVHLYVIRFQVERPVSEHLTRLILLFHIRLKCLFLGKTIAITIQIMKNNPENESIKVVFRFVA